MVGWLVRGALPGVRRIHAQVAEYARAWDEANSAVLSGTGKGPLWVVLGDSTAQGIGAPGHEEGYVGQLLRMLDERWPSEEGAWRVLNLSRSGARVADVVATQLPRLESAQADLEPALVTCAIGANDLVRRTPLDRVTEGLRTIIGRLPPGAVVATVPQGLHRPRTELLNELIRTEAPAAGLRVADVWQETAPPWHGKLAADGFHPGPLGYADWARAFARVLIPDIESET